MAAPPKRIRRSAEGARTALLDAAERRLVEVGPAGIRLQDVASDVGVSHPTVLHHFGSREGLIQAVVARAFDALDTRVLGAIATVPASDHAIGSLLEHVFGALSTTGYARTLVWLALEDCAGPARIGRLDAVIDAVHSRRSARRTTRGKPPPPLEDTQFAVLLAALALIGQSVLGPMLFPRAGHADAARSGERFRAWLGQLLIEHLDGGVNPPGARPAPPRRGRG